MAPDHRVPGVAAAAAQIGRDLQDHMEDQNIHGDGTNDTGGTATAPDNDLRMEPNDDGSTTVRGQMPFAVSLPHIEFNVGVNGQRLGATPPPPPGTGYMGEGPNYGWYGQQIGLGNTPQPTQGGQAVTNGNGTENDRSNTSTGTHPWAVTATSILIAIVAVVALLLLYRAGFGI